MKEHEFSFEVKNLNIYFKYLNEKNYKKVTEYMREKTSTNNNDNYKKTVLKRYIFQQKGLTFEMDQYTLPKEKIVITLRGNKSIVDEVYKEIKDL